MSRHLGLSVKTLGLAGPAPCGNSGRAVYGGAVLGGWRFPSAAQGEGGARGGAEVVRGSSEASGLRSLPFSGNELLRSAARMAWSLNIYISYCRVHTATKMGSFGHGLQRY